MVAALLTTALTIATVVGSAGQDPAVSVERGLPTSVLLSSVAGAVAITASAWTVHARHPLVSAGLAAVAAGQLLPVWAGWAWLPNGVRAAVLAAAPLAVGGSAQVALRWQARPVRSGALGAVWLLTGSAGLVHLVGYNPFADPSCLRTCDNIAPAARNVLSTHAAVVTAGLLAGAGALVAALAVWRSWPRPPWPVWAAVLVALVTLGGQATVTWIRWGSRAPSDITAVVVPSGTMALLGVAVVVAAARVTRTRVAVDRLVTRLCGPRVGRA